LFKLKIWLNTINSSVGNETKFYIAEWLFLLIHICNKTLIAFLYWCVDMYFQSTWDWETRLYNPVSLAIPSIMSLRQFWGEQNYSQIIEWSVVDNYLSNPYDKTSLLLEIWCRELFIYHDQLLSWWGIIWWKIKKKIYNLTIPLKKWSVLELPYRDDYVFWVKIKQKGKFSIVSFRSKSILVYCLLSWLNCSA
jgi:hypothetical protein